MRALLRAVKLATDLAPRLQPGKTPTDPLVRTQTALSGTSRPLSSPQPGAGVELARAGQAQTIADAAQGPIRKLSARYDGLCGGCGRPVHRGQCTRPVLDLLPKPPAAERSAAKQAELPISLNSVTGDSQTRALTAPPREIIRNEFNQAPDIQSKRTVPEVWGLPDATGIEQHSSPEESAPVSAW